MTKTFRLKLRSDSENLKTSFRAHGNLKTTEQQEDAIHNFLVAVCGGFMDEAKVREWAGVKNFKTGLPN